VFDEEAMFQIHKGCILRHGQPFVPIGFNYHPSAQGCQYWQQWAPAAIEHDFQRMAQLGFNTVRFFVFWADFEPVVGQYDQVALVRLRSMVDLADRYGLACIPSLLTIWMNGQLFDLPWRAGRDLWRDAEMVAREEAYVACIARTLADAHNIVAYDLGDEVIHVDYNHACALPREAVIRWQRRLAETIRREQPGALVFQAHEASTILGEHHFRPETSEALDLLGIHGYPVWTPFHIEAISSYKATSYAPFLVSYARSYGPVLVDELGCYGGDDRTTEAYLRACFPSLRVNGAQGMIVWCWQDFTTTARPYDVRPGERYVGLLDTDGRPKPGMAIFQEFAQRATTDWAGLRIPPVPIGVYIPERNDSPTSYLHTGDSSVTAAFYTYLLLKRAHLPFEFTHGPLDQYRMVLCPSVQQLTLHTQNVLADYVQRGGTLYFSTANYLHGFGGEDLFGIRLNDFTLAAETMASFTWREQSYPIEWMALAQSAMPVQIPIIEATRATILAQYANETPALTCHHFGAGKAFYLNAPYEFQLNAPYRLEAARWQSLYETLAHEAGIQRTRDIDLPEVELAALSDDQHGYDFLINHAPYRVEGTLSRYTPEGQSHSQAKVVLEAKQALVLLYNVGGRD
jgi:hypothetical protein